MIRLIKKLLTKKKPSTVIAAKFYFRSDQLSRNDIMGWINSLNHLISPLAFEWIYPFNIERFANWTEQDFKEKEIDITGENLNSGIFRDTEYFRLKYFSSTNESEYTFVQVVVKFEVNEKKMKLLDNFFCNQSLIAGFLYDYDYVREQSKTFLGMESRRWGKNIHKDQHGQKWIDISNNPARRTATKHFIYHGASKMWFGPEFFKNFPKEKLFAFDQAVEIKELENGIVFVHLYEGIFDGAKKENQQVQHDFRKLLNIDQLDVKINS